MWYNSQEAEHLVDPYSKLAYIYDDLMAHVDYKNWSRFIDKIIRRWHPGAHKILDISSGTATQLLKLYSKKYMIYGFDFSFNMVKVAKRKCKQRKVSIPLWQGNMTAFRLKQKVDVIVSLYDSVNYIIGKSGWEKMLDCAYDCLNDDGLFIFDICTEKNSRKYFHNYYEKNRGDGFFYTRESKYNAEDKIHTNRFEIYFDENKKTYVEFHEQKILKVREVMDLIQQTRFQILGAFHGFTFRPGDENSLRIHFVLKKKCKYDSIS